MSSQHTGKFESGDRFAFGVNWARFLSVMVEDHIPRTGFEYTLLNGCY